MNPNSYTLDLKKEVDKDTMLAYLKGMEGTLQVAYKKTRESQYLNENKKNVGWSEEGSAISSFRFF